MKRIKYNIGKKLEVDHKLTKLLRLYEYPVGTKDSTVRFIKLYLLRKTSNLDKGYLILISPNNMVDKNIEPYYIYTVSKKAAKKIIVELLELNWE